MLRRPPRSTLTYTLFPYTTLFRSEVDLHALFKDVAGDFVQSVTVPEQLPNVLDRAFRAALTRRAPAVVIVPNDVQELDYSAPTHDFKMVPSSLDLSPASRALPDEQALARAADVLNAGTKVALLIGQGDRKSTRLNSSH